MFALVKKEFNSFFNSTIGYITIGVYLTICGLFLFVFKGSYNILDSGFAELSPYFNLAPWVLLFLVPAITMSSIAEEKKQGTLELLRTKPISVFSIILGKFLGCLLLVFLALLPSIIYAVTVYQLGAIPGNLDIGSTLGSYIGLFLLAGAYTVIGICTSTLSTNQITGFLTGVLGCFIFYYGLDQLADTSWLRTSNLYLNQLGIRYHYERIGSGVLDSRDVIYFILFILFFLGIASFFLSKDSLKHTIRKKKIVGLLTAFLVLLIGSSFWYSRFDLTTDKRFTLSPATQQLLAKAEVPITIDVLLDGDLPSEFRKLQSETRQLLTEFRDLQPKLDFIFTNPLEEEEYRKETLQELQKLGLTPAEVSVQESGKTEIETVVPWAILNFKNKTVKVPLLKNKLGESTEQRVTNSIQQLEYVFAEALQKLIEPKKYKIAVLKGNGQLADRYIADFVKNLQKYYFIGKFTLDSVASNPQKTLDDLTKFDLIINAKPTQAFSEEEKYVLDQYIMQGGKSLWLIDKVGVELDSLFSQKAARQTVAFNQNLNLTDLLFAYGVRINPVLVNDLSSAPLMLASGEGNNTKFNPYRWFYASLTNQPGTHPITKNIEAVKFDFSNQIDTLPNAIKKTVLLTSSKNTKLQGVPLALELEKLLSVPPQPESYTMGPQALAVLLEGTFPSAYYNKIKPFSVPQALPESKSTKMVVIADGDVIKNSIRKGQPVSLGYDPYINLQYGNKEFLLNTVNYLLEDTGLIQIRGKEVEIAFLDLQKVASEKEKWQLINIVIPLLLLTLFSWLVKSIRKKRFGKPN
ncbi:gliding motility-associated ABC transporter substrate-binding protein GldG [Aquimarina sp. ERC-38]|uniref:gliding motility-associated ABC transporter substrate-binding protein GldG n=1 Tax=Aquimarina sp. ERC-38 TaxID=2949996 RepID=UPI00224504A7|nr:gliding motility-associated ABC transporter substrate-binding protein GldG [Aquimarina sp. ERC-38]UZO79483.1 gliding motility-associated ABC transporter substrate-binding protein GldG [Aquimarina sp. ERC-38]